MAAGAVRRQGAPAADVLVELYSVPEDFQKLLCRFVTEGTEFFGPPPRTSQDAILSRLSCSEDRQAGQRGRPAAATNGLQEFARNCLSFSLQSSRDVATSCAKITRGSMKSRRVVLHSRCAAFIAVAAIVSPAAATPSRRRGRESTPRSPERRESQCSGVNSHVDHRAEGTGLLLDAGPHHGGGDLAGTVTAASSISRP